MRTQNKIKEILIVMEQVNGVAFWSCQKSISRHQLHTHMISFDMWFPRKNTNYARLVILVFPFSPVSWFHFAPFLSSFCCIFCSYLKQTDEISESTIITHIIAFLSIALPSLNLLITTVSNRTKNIVFFNNKVAKKYIRLLFATS